MKARVDHIGIAVKGLEERLAFWRDALGLSVSGIEEVATEKVRVAFLPAGSARLELIEATSPDSPIAKFIEKRGEGLQQLALAVDSVQEVLDRLKAKGVPLLDDVPRPGAEGTRVAFLHPKATGGVLVELVEHPHRHAARVEPGAAILAYLREPQEKLWGVLRSLDAAGATLEALDLASFDDWCAQVERGDESVVGPSVVFVPMSRVEKLLLDRPSGNLPSLVQRFESRTGRTVDSVLG
jgi:methylmalonyl-CoA epimerase